MPSTPQRRYELELWINGSLVGDISELAKDRTFSLKRNDSEELTFNMDLTAFEAYCAELGKAPQELLEAYVTDIRVKRLGLYYFGVHVVELDPLLNAAGASLGVKATGFLDLFADRYVTKNYDGEERTDIARDLFVETQSGDATNDFGVIAGAQQYNTGITDTERDYIDQNVKDAEINLTQLQDGNYDFRFTYDRQFETYEQIGSDRPNNKFTFPYNIGSLSAPRSAIGLANYIIGLGSGIGEETLRSEQSDTISRGNYKTRQKILTFNSVSSQDILDNNTGAEVARRKDILQIPKLSLNNTLCDLGVIGVGDRVPVEVQGHPAIQIDGTYRIEQINVSLDDNDAEDITLLVDNFGL